MFSLPPLPAYDGMHPIVVHFPIVLIMIAPLFVFLSLICKPHKRALLLCACINLTLGVAFTFLALSTGEAAEGFAEAVPAAKPVLERHEELAEMTRNLALGAWVLLILLTIAQVRGGERLSVKTFNVACVIYLLVYSLPILALSNTAHEGGRLVHEFGVLAPLTKGISPAENPQDSMSPAPTGTADEEQDEE